jgi:urate oxidase
MAAVLTDHSYGKSRIRLAKVTRGADRSDVRELTIEIQLEGDFAGSYASGDNRLIIPTDTMKNVAYALAREHQLESIEEFGAVLVGHFLEHHPHVVRVTACLSEQPLVRLSVQGREHPHAFIGNTGETRTATVRRWPDGVRVQSGIDGLFLLKAAGSAFAGFLRDRYTTLPEADDRILATILKAEWLYSGGECVWKSAHACIRQTLLETFARHQSLSVQHTLYAMGAAALDSCPEIERISLTMLNKHHIPVDLKSFDLDNHNEVFIATDEPYGTISGTLQRS